MAEDTAGLVNVEDDTTPPPASAAPVAAAAPAVPEPPPDPDDEAAVEVQGDRYVPLPALKAVRAELKDAKARAAERDTLAAENARLKGQVEGYQQVAQQLQHARPPAPAAPQTDDRALAFARGLDLYRPGANGQAEPDIDKAQAILGIVREMAKQEAGTLVQPMAVSIAQQRSGANYNWALNQKDQNGRTVPKQVIDEMWSKMPVEYTADPQIARTLWLTGLGMSVANAQPQAAVPPPPVPTEGLGAAPRGSQRMSQLEENIARDRGIKPDKWAENTKGFVPGRTTVLE